MKAKKIVVRLEDINYIPEYKIEEQQRRINEVERQENEAERQAHETERIALYEDMQEKLETGYFNGEDGYSPSSSVSKSGNTTTITVTDKEGTTTALVLDGVDGTDGSDGQDAKINGVNTLTIEAGSNITLEQEGSTLTISSTGGGTSDYSDLSNKPSINNVTLSGNKTTSDLGINIPDVSNFITKDVNDLTYYTKTSSLANVATSGSYNDLSNKPTIPTVPTNVSAFTNDAGYTTNTGTYSKPSGGIPKTDLASAVQTSLGKADTALQSFTETDPVFSASASAGISSSDIINWDGKLSSSLVEEKDMIVTYSDDTTETVKLVVYK